MDEQKGWHYRGYLPHFDGRQTPQFITFRLHDSLPTRVLNAMKLELTANEVRGIDDLELHRRVERFLDSGHGKCYLVDSRIASTVEAKFVELNQTSCRSSHG